MSRGSIQTAVDQFAHHGLWPQPCDAMKERAFALRSPLGRLTSRRHTHKGPVVHHFRQLAADACISSFVSIENKAPRVGEITVTDLLARPDETWSGAGCDWR